MAPNPICCPFEKGKFGLGDRYAQRECDVKTHRGDSHVPGWMCLIAQESKAGFARSQKRQGRLLPSSHQRYSSGDALIWGS